MKINQIKTFRDETDENINAWLREKSENSDNEICVIAVNRQFISETGSFPLVYIETAIVYTEEEKAERNTIEKNVRDKTYVNNKLAEIEMQTDSWHGCHEIPDNDSFEYYAKIKNKETGNVRITIGRFNSDLMNNRSYGFANSCMLYRVSESEEVIGWRHRRV